MTSESLQNENLSKFNPEVAFSLIALATNTEINLKKRIINTGIDKFLD